MLASVLTVHLTATRHVPAASAKSLLHAPPLSPPFLGTGASKLQPVCLDLPLQGRQGTQRLGAVLQGCLSGPSRKRQE